MPLHPLARKFLDDLATRPPVETLTVEEARARALDIARCLPPGEAVAGVRDLEIPGPRGPILLRVYTPAGNGPFAGWVFFHGGGWVVGGIETADGYCRSVTNASGCVVISVGYRRAPEHRFPAALDDAFAATRWVAENAALLGIDPARLGVGGNSAGGNLAALAAIRAREAGGPALRCQVLSVPVTDYAFDTASYRENAQGYGLTRAAMEWFWGHYLASPADGALASPLRVPDLAGLPPAFVLTAEFDPLRDEGEAYARRLADAGVDVTLRRYEGMVHMFLGPESVQDVGRFLRDRLEAST
jgi:acetyl esterase